MLLQVWANSVVTQIRLGAVCPDQTWSSLSRSDLKQSVQIRLAAVSSGSTWFAKLPCCLHLLDTLLCSKITLFWDNYTSFGCPIFFLICTVLAIDKLCATGGKCLKMCKFGENLTCGSPDWTVFCLNLAAQRLS